MRPIMRRFVLTMALLLPTMGSAQVAQIRTPLPEVNAGSANWQVNSIPIVFGSLIFYPTREFRMFDGGVMAQIGIYEGVPIYADMTRAPFTAIYVPVSSVQLRAYEHPQIIATPGAYPGGPQPVGIESIVRGPTIQPATVSSGPAPTYPVVVEPVRVVGTAGSIVPRVVDMTPAPPRNPRQPALETIPRPRGTNGVWLEFNGARWFSAGDAVSYSADRFTAIGTYHGFTVYRDRTGSQDEIWVPAVTDGPLAPYRKR